MYRFNLEPVLNYLTLAEEKVQKELAIFKSVVDDEARKLMHYEKEQNRCLQELAKKQKQSITISVIALYRGFLDRISKDYDRQRERVLEAEKRFDKKREDLIAAMKKKKTMEKLKEKRLKAYSQVLMKKERDAVNEAAINGYNRESRQQG